MSQAVRVSEFFKYHGLWAPGIRLFRKVSFSIKATLISLVFIVPLSWVSWQYFSDKAAAIEFSAKEHDGVTYAQALMPALAAAQHGEDMSSPMAALQKVEASVGQELGTAKAFQAATSATPPEQASALMSLLAAATDGSNLTLDPDIDSYYLMDASMFRLPLLANYVAQMKSLGQGMLQRGQSTPDEVRKLTELSALAREQSAALSDGLNKAHAYNPATRGAVNGEAVLGEVAAFLKEVDQSFLQNSGTPMGQPESFGAHAAALHADTLALVNRSSQELNRLIGVRVSGLVTARNVTAAVMALFLLCAVYLFMSFKRVLDGGLREVAYHLTSIRDGDLTTRPKAWGGDEVASLIGALQQMQASLGDIVQRVRESSDSLLTGASEISAGAMDLSARTEANAASLQQTSASMSAMSDTVKHSAASSERAAGMANENAQVAQRGSIVMKEVIQTMDGVRTSSGKIGDIISVIDGIAFQTNILALNAAVEAARAGEQGKGFAVVATEVRALALRSANAAQEIKQLVTESMERVSASTRVVEAAGATMDELMSNADHMQKVLMELSGSATSQSAGITQIGSAVQDLDQSTQQNAALVEQTAAAATSVKDLAQQMADRVKMFKLQAASV
ncbi:methyl-accepting chemotaxis protein [Aquabacterium sp.]|uniref:methyl-accepting chemotaxis protein n=1 Tax=Aquabacterium sp. TaxID=1872578 RepID=UPI0035B14414